MDGTQFDALIKRFSTTTLSRSAALRGLAASVAAFGGVTLGAEPGAAQERTICHCEDASSTSCETRKVGKKAATRHLRDHPCDYKGKCHRVSGCCTDIGSGCSTRLTCCSGNCLGGVCQACKSIGTNCAFNSECCSRNCNITCKHRR